MPTVIDSLVVTLGLDASKFTAEQKKAVSSLKQFEDAANRHGKSAQQGIDGLVGSFKELQGRLLAIGALITAGLGFNRLVQDVTKANTELGQLSKTLQISGENLSAWDHVGRTVGAATNEMSQGIKKLDYELSKLRAGMGSDLMAWMGTVGVPGVANMRTGEDVFRGLNAYYNQQAAKGPQQAKDAAFQIQNFAGLSQGQLNAVMLPPQEFEKRFAFGKKFAPTQDDIDKFTKLTQAFNDLLTVIDKITRDALTPFIVKLTELLNGLTNWLGNTFGGNKNPAAAGALGMDWLRPGSAGSAGSANDNRPISQGSADVNTAIERASKAYGLDPVMMKGIASIESSMDPTSNMNAGTQYKGLFQIGRSEWATHGQGNIYNAEDNAFGAARLMRANIDSFKKAFGRDPTPTEVYMMHQQGLGFYTNGTMTNIGGNPYPGMNGPQTPATFEAGWGRELNRRMSRFRGSQGDAPAWSGPRLRVTPGASDIPAASPTFNDLWNNRIGIGAKTSMLRGGDTSNTNNSNTTTNIGSMNVSVPPGADPSAYADGISRRLADYDNIQNANTGLV